MRIAEWKTFWEGLLDGVRQELSPADSAEKAALDTLRTRLKKPLIPRRRKRFEDELEALIEGNPVLKLAADRYLCKKVPAAIAEAEATLKRGQYVLEKSKRMKRRSEWVN
jgi:hypothetical protein